MPGAPRAAIVGRQGEAWKVKVKPAPERGGANGALMTLLAETLAIPRRNVRLVSGHGTRDKMVELTGLDPDDVDRALSSAAERDRR